MNCAMDEVMLVRLDFAVARKQTLRIEHENPRVSFAGGEALSLHPFVQGARDANPSRARPMHDDALVRQSLATQASRDEHTCQCDGARTLNVVIEGREDMPIPLEHRESGVFCQVLPLEHRARPSLLHRLDKSVHEREVRCAAKPRMSDAQVERIVDQSGSVTTNVEGDRKGMPRRDATNGVQRELPDRDCQSAIALITQSQYRRRIGRDDHTNVIERTIVHVPVHLLRAIGDREPACILIERVELLYSLADRRRVHDRQHLFQVGRKKCIEQHLIPVLKGAKKLVLRQVRRDL